MLGGACFSGFDSANRTWVLRTTGVNVNGGWMTSPFGS
jgi:hypothetical protein